MTQPAPRARSQTRTPILSGPLGGLACLLAAVILLLSASGPARGAPAQRVILFIGDGLGPGLVTAARIVCCGVAGRLAIDELDHTARMRTYSADSLVTDSAAGATAIATGQKTKNSVLGEDAEAVYPDIHGRRLPTILEQASRHGWRTGIVTTTEITDATPAAFYSHRPNRHEQAGIALDAMNSDIKLFFGGGKRRFLARKPGGSGGARKDGRDLLSEWRKRGAWILADPTKLSEVANQASARPVVGLFADGHFPFAVDLPARGSSAAGALPPDLPTMVRTAIARLGGDGARFMLVVEGGRIDHAAHQNRARAAIEEVIEFDAAVEAALEATSKKDTFVLVTADHDTGGLAISGYPRASVSGDKLFEARSAAKQPALTWASGPGRRLWGLGAVFDILPGLGPPPPAAVRDSSALHTAVDVPVWASGPVANRVRGLLDNTDIYRLLALAAGLSTED